VGGIEEFRVTSSAASREPRLAANQPIPGVIVLKDGQVLDNIHHIVLATGYITSYPFLAHLHADDTSIEDAGDETLITSDGDIVHNLHEDIFYIPNPTLAFIGVPYHSAAFTLFGFQAQVLARVFAGKARLPSRKEMVEDYKRRVKEKGLGRSLHSLAAAGAEVAYVKDLVDWVNRDGEVTGEPRILAHTKEWVDEYDALKARLAEAWFGKKSEFLESPEG
jgi:hypothetical protein